MITTSSPAAERRARFRAAHAAIDATGGDMLLVAWAECFLRGHSQPLDEQRP